jgi:hypothetical protein
MDDVLVRGANSWKLFGGGSGGGISWSNLGEGDRGVLRYGDEAPEGASIACVTYEGDEYRVPVRHRHFLFVAWDTPFSEDPRLVGFD